VTLIELLIVIGIILALSAIAIPALSPSLNEMRMREAARGVAAFIQGARDQAMKRRRSFGIRIERFRDPKDASLMIPQAGYRLIYIEQPPTYSGDYEGSRAKIVWMNAGTPRGNQNCIVGLGAPVYDGTNDVWNIGLADGGWYNKIAPGFDRIRFGYQGIYYKVDYDIKTSMLDPATNRIIEPPSATNPWPLIPESFDSSNTGLMPNVVMTSNLAAVGKGEVVPYEIFRYPVRSGRESLELPQSVVIDLDASGTYSSSELFRCYAKDDMRPVDILFGPDGTVERILYSHSGNAALMTSQRVTDSIYLLVGRSDKILDLFLNPTGFQDPAIKTNWGDFNNRWVVINSTSGRVVSCPVGTTGYANSASSENPFISTGASKASQITTNRGLARVAAQDGGR